MQAVGRARGGQADDRWAGGRRAAAGLAIRHPTPLMERLEPSQSPPSGPLCGGPLGVFCCLLALVSSENLSECATCKLNSYFWSKKLYFYVAK